VRAHTHTKNRLIRPFSLTPPPSPPPPTHTGVTAPTICPPHMVTTALGCLYNLVSGNRSAKERLLLYPNIPQLLIEILDQTQAALFVSHNEEEKNRVGIAVGGAAVRGDGEAGRDQVGEDRLHSEVLRCLLCISSLSQNCRAGWAALVEAGALKALQRWIPILRSAHPVSPLPASVASHWLIEVLQIVLNLLSPPSSWAASPSLRADSAGEQETKGKGGGVGRGAGVRGGKGGRRMVQQDEDSRTLETKGDEDLWWKLLSEAVEEEDLFNELLQLVLQVRGCVCGGAGGGVSTHAGRLIIEKIPVILHSTIFFFKNI
jgi:hypothetical protein